MYRQIFPRYKNPVEFAGLTDEDKKYGKFYNNDAVRPFNGEVVKQLPNN